MTGHKLQNLSIYTMIISTFPNQKLITDSNIDNFYDFNNRKTNPKLTLKKFGRSESQKSQVNRQTLEIKTSNSVHQENPR